MIQRILLLVHLFGLAMAIIPIVILDLRYVMILATQRVSRFDRSTLQRFSPVIRAGGGLVWVSALTLTAYYALTGAHHLFEMNYWLLIVSAAVLTANSILLEKSFLRVMHRQ